MSSSVGREVVDQAGADRRAGRRWATKRSVIDAGLAHRRSDASADAVAQVAAVEVGRDPEPRAVEAEAADELDGRRAGDGEADVVDHLPLVVLVHADDARAGCGPGDGVARERQQRDRTHEPDPSTFPAEAGDRGAHVLRGRAERDHDDVGVVGVAGLDQRCDAGQHLLGARRAARVVLREVVAAALVALGGAERRQQPRPAGATGGPVERPVVGRDRWEVERRQGHRGGRVREVVVAEQQHRVAPSRGEVERQLRELGGFGHVHRRQDRHAGVAVPGAARGLPVVALRTRHVEHHHRHRGVGELGQRLLHEREPLAGRSRRAAVCRWRPHPTPCRPPRARSRRSCTCPRRRAAWPPCARAPR